MISLLVVNYRSSALAEEAIRSARAAARTPLQVVVVDNSCDVAEADALRPHADVVVAPSRNLGYAVAINAGRVHCKGDVIIVSNPDVVFGERAIEKLVSAIDMQRAAVAGPALFWDDAHAWMLPPSELHTASEKLGEALASRSRSFARFRDRRRIAARLQFWSLAQTTETTAISGAVMAIRAADFDSIGGFDERFPLYFEENDFLRRIHARGKRIVYVPSAKCRHLYNQSAGADVAHATTAYAESEMRYLAKWHGGTMARLLKTMERPRMVTLPARLDSAIALPARDVVVEASPLASFETAAGHFPAGSSADVPAEVWDSYRSEALFLRVVDRKTRAVLATYARYRS
ncbi:MAG TPA: glycosyltransferase family 2 protein [Thermoanaerobaculia bacterium]|nr:glycosyltransferase family 2 protein [Thermoanaerobaculia bacterium]